MLHFHRERFVIYAKCKKRTEDSSMKEKIRIGFVGCGQFARNFVPLFQAHPACEYVAVCDKFRDRAENYMEKFKVDI